MTNVSRLRRIQRVAAHVDPPSPSTAATSNSIEPQQQLQLNSFGILPPTVSDPQSALAVVQSVGACVVRSKVDAVTGEATLRAAASEVAQAVFGATFVASKQPCAIRAPPTKADAAQRALFSPTSTGAERLNPHNDGWDIYGELRRVDCLVSSEISVCCSLVCCDSPPAFL